MLEQPSATSPRRHRSKTVAAWLALLAGAFGAHRFYLEGWRDRQGWWWWLPSGVGLGGLLRLRTLGLDDALGALLVPWLGLSLSGAMLVGIVYALTPDARWDERHNPGARSAPAGWGAVLAAVAALGLGGVTLIGTLAYAIQRFFEWQLQAGRGLPALA